MCVALCKLSLVLCAGTFSREQRRRLPSLTMESRVLVRAVGLYHIAGRPEAECVRWSHQGVIISIDIHLLILLGIFCVFVISILSRSVPSWLVSLSHSETMDSSMYLTWNILCTCCFYLVPLLNVDASLLASLPYSISIDVSIYLSWNILCFCYFHVPILNRDDPTNFLCILLRIFSVCICYFHLVPILNRDANWLVSIETAVSQFVHRYCIYLSHLEHSLYLLFPCSDFELRRSHSLSTWCIGYFHLVPILNTDASWLVSLSRPISIDLSYVEYSVYVHICYFPFVLILIIPAVFTYWVQVIGFTSILSGKWLPAEISRWNYFY